MQNSSIFVKTLSDKLEQMEEKAIAQAKFIFSENWDYNSFLFSSLQVFLIYQLLWLYPMTLEGKHPNWYYF